MSTNAATPLPMTPPIVRRIRAYFAPVNRTAGVPTIFDPAQIGSFNLDAPPLPWLDLGWLDSFERKSGTKIAALRSGAPGLSLSQVRTEIDSVVKLSFLSWGKLQMAVTSGSEQMNLLAPMDGAPMNGSGGGAAAATPLLSGCTASFLNIAAEHLSSFTVGQMVCVDVDYTGQTGYVGSGVSGAYVSTASSVHSDENYIRRISFNIGRVAAVTSSGLQLMQQLIGGAPVVGMSVQPILGFVDREGSNFFSEWSGLFVLPGEQGDRICLHYPRLQIASGATESMKSLGTSTQKVDMLSKVIQVAEFRALPVTDLNDGAQVVCFRSYIPAANTMLW